MYCACGAANFSDDRLKIRLVEIRPKILINNTETFKKERIEKELNKYFVKVGSNLAAKIQSYEKHFSEYIQSCAKIMRNWKKIKISTAHPLSPTYNAVTSQNYVT